VIYLWVEYGNPVTGALHNLSGRNLLWAAAVQATGENPVLGIGPGCWSIWLRSHYVAADFIMGDFRGNSFALSPALLGGEAHNLFFTKMAEMGIPSLAWIACMFLAWFFKARSAVQKLPKGWGRVLGMGSLAAVIGLFVRGFFENGPIIGKGRGSEVIVVWFIVALPFVLRHLAVATETTPGQEAAVVQENRPSGR